MAVFSRNSRDIQADEPPLTNTADDVAGDNAMADSDATPVPSIGVPTLGGRQFWGDLSYRAGWKIQRNVFTGHCRLLNASDFRFASGTREHCEAVLQRIVRRDNLPPDRGKAVILLHGIGRSSRSFFRMAAELRSAGYVVIPFEYPSTRITLEQAAEYLKSVIESIPHVNSVDFVAHSMGGLVVRTLLKDYSDPRLHSLVMLGTPNHGAELADMLHRSTLFRLVYGPAGSQLKSGADAAVSQLPTPSIPFGIIAGGRGDDSGFNPILSDDNDGTVTVASTRLSGAADFLQVPRLHSFLMSDETVLRATLCFLQTGQFDPMRPACPIPESMTPRAD